MCYHDGTNHEERHEDKDEEDDDDDEDDEDSDYAAAADDDDDDMVLVTLTMMMTTIEICNSGHRSPWQKGGQIQKNKFGSFKQQVATKPVQHSA